MNTPFVRWLLNLDVIPADAEGLRLVWERPLAAWVWVLLIMGAALLAAWSYSRLMGNRHGRVVLAVARFVLIIMMLLVLSGPMLELPRETVEQDWVLMLLDRSASMAIKDVAGEDSADGNTGRRSRDQQLRDLLAKHGPMWEQLAESRHVVWLGFHDGVFDLVAADGTEPAGSPVELDEPDGRRTRLNAALQQALQRAAARALSGVVIFSDGRTIDPPTRASIRRLRSDKVGVFTVPLGSAQPLGDLAIRRVEAPRRAFIRDKVPVVVELDQLGTAAVGATATVKLVDADNPEIILDSVELTASLDGIDRVTLTAEPMLAGEATWRVIVETDPPDLIADNNVKTFVIDLIDRPLSVLYVDGYPRWEFRYFKNLMIREKSIESSVMLLSADRDFAQEGNQPITRLPRSPEEFAPFDVIVLGDVPGSFFSPEQLDMIQDHVALRGAGLLWIGGERYTPRTYAGTALADLLPLRGALSLPPIGVPVNMVPTALAERLGLLRLTDADDDEHWPKVLADPTSGWSRLAWAQRIEPGRLKPTAEVLAETLSEFRGAHLPLVIQMRYGAGRIIYVATDEIWRWRYGRGERLPDRFWVQIIRRLGRESLAGSQDAVTLEVSPRRLTTTQVMLVDLELLDARLFDDSRESITAVVETADGRPVAELELRRTDPRSESGRGRAVSFATTWRPSVTGHLRIRVDDPALAGARMTVPVEVFTPDDELRRPETDHMLLATLSAETGGRMLPPEDLGRLASLLPNRSVTTINPLTERIWDTPLIFGLVLFVIACEWIGRKLIRLA